MIDVMLHGWASSHASWQPLCSHLPEHKAHFISLPGHNGFSDQGSINQQLMDIEAPYLLYAWSLGSLLAIDHALSHPEKVAGLVLFSPIACFIANNHWPHAMPKAIFEQFRHRFFKKSSPDYRYFRLLAASGSQSPREHAELLAQLDDSLPLPSLAGLQMGLEQLENQDMIHLLSELSMPVLLITGTQDALVPVESVIDLSKRIKQVEYSALEDVGHLPHVIAPQACARIISQWKVNALV